MFKILFSWVYILIIAHFSEKKIKDTDKNIDKTDFFYYNGDKNTERRKNHECSFLR